MQVSRAREVVLWALWATLALIWVSTLLSAAQRGDWKLPAFAVLDLLLLWVLFFAEGLELAAADLLDKDVDQIKDLRSRSILAAIKERPDWFFAHRQVFVVTIIAVMSLTTSYEAVTVPFVGSVSEYGVPFAFSLAFTTLTVLWFCQVTPKRLAIANSEHFLRASSWVWNLITVVARLGLPDPANNIVALVKNHSAYRRPRVLSPSRGQFYNLTARFFRNALDRVSVSVRVADDGSVEVRRRVLHIFTDGNHEAVVGYFDSASGFLDDITVRVCGLFACPPAPERIDDLAEDLDRIFAGEVTANENAAHTWPHRIETFSSSSPELLPRMYWMISGPVPMPADVSNNGGFIALVYEASVRMAPGGLSLAGADDPGRGTWREPVTYACRRFDLRVEADRPELAAPYIDGCALTLGEQRRRLDVETAEVVLNSGHNHLWLPFPLLSGTYDISWRVLPIASVVGALDLAAAAGPLA